MTKQPSLVVAGMLFFSVDQISAQQQRAPDLVCDLTPILAGPVKG